MRKNSWIEAGALALLLGAPLPALAAPTGADLITGDDVEGILAIAQGRGDAEREDQENGNPLIIGNMGGISYYIYFFNCDDGGKACEDINFYAGFTDVKPGLENINEWNRDHRFGRAYLDQDEDAAIEFDINLEYGVSRDNLDAGFLVWGVILDEFTSFIDYEK